MKSLRAWFRPKVKRQRLPPPSYPEAANDVAALSARGRFVEAIAMSRRLIDAAPHDAACHDVLGIVLLDAQRPQEAEQAFAKACALDSHQLTYVVHLSTALTLQDRDSEILDLCRTFCESHPLVAEAHFNLGLAYANRFDGDNAERTINAGIALDPAAAAGFVALGQAMTVVGRTQDAVNACLQAIALNEGVLTEIALSLSELLASRGRGAEGVAYCEKAVARVGPSPSALKLLAHCYEKRGMRQEAVRVLGECVERYPGDARAWALLGHHCAGLGRYDEAADHLAKARGLAQNDNVVVAFQKSFKRAVDHQIPAVRKRAAEIPGPHPVPGDCIIVIRGAMDPTCCDIVKHYRAAHRDTYIILSTWRDTAPAVLDQVADCVDEIVLNDKPSLPGMNNLNFQIICAANGVIKAKERGATHILVTRTDVALLRPNLLTDLRHLTAKYPLAPSLKLGLKGRLIVSDAFSVIRPFYHVSDLFMFGHVDDVAQFWSHDHATGESLRPECILSRGLAGKIGWPVRNTVQDSLAFYRDVVVVRDAAWFGLLWIKNPCHGTTAHMDPDIRVMSEKMWQALQPRL